MENNQDKLNEIFPAQDAGQKPENPPVEDTVVVPAIGAQAQKPEAEPEPAQPGETAAGASCWRSSTACSTALSATQTTWTG